MGEAWRGRSVAPSKPGKEYRLVRGAATERNYPGPCVDAQTTKVKRDAKPALRRSRGDRNRFFSTVLRRSARRRVSAGTTFDVLWERENKGILEEFLEFFPGHGTVVENLVQQSRPYCFTRVYRHNRSMAVRMSQEIVAALDPCDLEAGLCQSGYHRLPVDALKSSHTCTVIR